MFVQYLVLLFFTVFILQFTKQQRFSCNRVGAIQKLSSLVSQVFSENIPERNVPNKRTIWKNVKKYRDEGTKRM